MFIPQGERHPSRSVSLSGGPGPSDLYVAPYEQHHQQNSVDNLAQEFGEFGVSRRRESYPVSALLPPFTSNSNMCISFLLLGHIRKQYREVTTVILAMAASDMGMTILALHRFNRQGSMGRTAHLQLFRHRQCYQMVMMHNLQSEDPATVSRQHPPASCR